MFNQIIRKMKARAKELHVYHRVIYLSLAICHLSGCFITEKPELYGPMAVLYGLLVIIR